MKRRRASEKWMEEEVEGAEGRRRRRKRKTM